MAERTLEKPAKKWAREYETIYILRPNVETEEANKVATRVRDVLERTGAKLTKVDVWGKRRLAYDIGKFTRGIFVYVGYAAHGDVVAELERNLRLLETVMRYQTIVVADRIDLDEVEVDSSEIEFAEIEQSEDEDDEPTTAERLGMEERTREEPAAAKAKADDSDSDDSDSDEDDSDSSKDDDSDGDNKEEEEEE